jgi:hypothetical protein
MPRGWRLLGGGPVAWRRRVKRDRKEREGGVKEEQKERGRRVKRESRERESKVKGERKGSEKRQKREGEESKKRDRKEDRLPHALLGTPHHKQTLRSDRWS